MSQSIFPPLDPALRFALVKVSVFFCLGCPLRNIGLLGLVCLSGPDFFCCWRSFSTENTFAFRVEDEISFPLPRSRRSASSPSPSPSPSPCPSPFPSPSPSLSPSPPPCRRRRRPRHRLAESEQWKKIQNKGFL